MMSQSAHDPRMRPNGGRGGRGRGPGPRPRSRERFQNPNGNPSSFSSQGEKPQNMALDDSDVSDVESDAGSFGGESAPPLPPPPPPTSPPPPPPSVTKPTSMSSIGGHARFKDNQMALYTPDDGTGLQLVQIIKVQAFKGKNNMPCYKIRLQGSNVEKTMVKEPLLMELEEAPGVGNAATKLSPRSPKSLKKPTTPGKKKKKKNPKNLDSSVHSSGNLSPKTKKKKKKGSRSKSPTRAKSPTRKNSKGERPNTLKKTRSLEDMKKVKKTSKVEQKEVVRAVRRSSSWDGKGLPVTRKESAASAPGNQKWDTQAPQQPLFKLPRRTKTQPVAASNAPKPPRRTPSAPAPTPNDDDSVESELGSDKFNKDAPVKKPDEVNLVQEGETNSSSSEDTWDESYAIGTPNAGKKGVKRSSKEQMKQKTSAEKAQNQSPDSSSEESDLDEAA
mmetsp:Transcript_19143/g.47323  ORF Transcript_19143/g.47323 Transcript_19143/m.47323 type:complete len:445 (+) Transcript_19143:2-1336(+)